jgi:hypothetical protein
VLRISGISVELDDASNLANRLMANSGNPGAVEAGTRISRAVEEGGGAVSLDLGQREALLYCLDNPGPRLVELRAALIREWGRRQASGF